MSLASRSAALVPVLLGVCLAVACTGEDPVAAAASQPDAGTDAPVVVPTEDAAVPPQEAGPASRFAIDPPLVRVLRGGTVKATVTLTRDGVAGDVSVTVGGLPAGVTASVAPIAAGTTSAEATFTATDSAPFGAVPFTLTAANVVDLTASLVVAGLPGAVDDSFDQDGLVLDSAASATGQFSGVLVQPDGKIVAVGTLNAAGGAWAVRRYESDGAPDVAFNTKAAAAMPASNSALGVALDPQKNRIVVVGSSTANAELLTIVRLNADGSPDQSFANGGTSRATTIEHPQGSRGHAVIVNADSSLLVAGIKNTASPSALVEKYDATGQKVSTGFTHYEVDSRRFSAILPLPLGTFIATGEDNSLNPPQPLAVRFEAKGTPDSTFGNLTNGSQSYPSGSGCQPRAATLTKSGDVVVVGKEVFGPSLCELRLAGSVTGTALWYKTAGGGNADAFYGVTNGGLASTADLTYSVGQVNGTYDRYALIVRRLANGDADPAWGSTGERRFEDPGTPDAYGFRFGAVTSTPEGRLVVAGRRTGGSAGFMLVRLWE